MMGEAGLVSRRRDRCCPSNIVLHTDGLLCSPPVSPKVAMWLASRDSKSLTCLNYSPIGGDVCQIQSHLGPYWS